jgi:starch synthase
MKVLFAAWELDPFFKFGGLGDVARSLPAALKEIGVDIRNIIPFYNVLKLGRNKKKKVGKFNVEYGGKKEKVEIYQVLNPKSYVPVYLLRNKTYLSIAKSPDTFAFFDKAIAEIIQKNYLFWLPDVLHCNDHHTGLIPLLIRSMHLPIKTVFTIHNLSYQGINSTEVLEKLKVDHLRSKVMNWEIKSRQLNFLMEGIIHADVITTVSPTYAHEIMTEEYGAGLEEVLRGKEGRVFGILNGIDVKFNQSLHSKAVKYPYANKNLSWEEGKRHNKLYLQKKLGLRSGENIPLLSFIGRFDPRQKGIEIIHKMMRRIDVEKYEFVILGTGNQEWEERYQWLSKFYPKNVSCNFRFDDVLAYQIYAASDFILIPSKFEPCGLIQMIAMSFGTLPIAHKTGGLADSIKDDVNGFLFDKYTSVSLEKTVKKALGIWHTDKPRYKKMVEAALNTDFSWRKSAMEYLELYNKLINGIL